MRAAVLTVLIEILIHLFGELTGARAHCRPAHHSGLGMAHLEIREILNPLQQPGLVLPEAGLWERGCIVRPL